MTSHVVAPRGLSTRAPTKDLSTFACSSARIGGVHMICLVGELDVATAPAVERELRRVEATDAREIVLDLSGLTFMDSNGVHLVLNADARSRSDSRRLRLLRGPAAVQRVFRLTAVEERLPFVD